MIKRIIIFELLLLGVSAMPQPTGYGDDDGDDNGVDGDMEDDYYYIWWDEKKKGWEHQLHQDHYYCEKIE